LKKYRFLCYIEENGVSAGRYDLPPGHFLPPQVGIYREPHLDLICDPVGGLVKIPLERAMRWEL